MAWKSFPLFIVTYLLKIHYAVFIPFLKILKLLYPPPAYFSTTCQVWLHSIPRLWRSSRTKKERNKERKKQRKKERLGKEIYSRLAGHPQFSRWQKSLTKYTPVYLMSNYKAFDCLIVLSLVNLLTCSRSWGLFFLFFGGLFLNLS